MIKILRNHPLISICILFFCMGMQGEHQKKVLLRLKLEKGASYTIKTTVDQDISQSPMGQQMDMHQFIGTTYRYEVEDIKNEVYQIKTIYDRVQFSQDGPMGSVNYDSEENPVDIDPAALGYAGMVGLSFNMQMNNMGQILSLEGIDEMIEETIKRTLEGLDNPTPEMEESIRTSVGSMISEEGLKNSMENMTAFYPEKAIKKGDTWDREVKISLGMTLMINSTYKVVSIDDDKITLSVTGSMKSDKDQAMTMGNFTMKYDISGEQSGRSVVDITTGWAERAEISQKMEGEVSMSGSELGNEIQWPINFSTKTITEMKPENE